ncbi:hypothetical protein MRB53_040408 [Persea americana]|nr:hypothetical protein MRB53_040408 [Persea americana]
MLSCGCMLLSLRLQGLHVACFEHSGTILCINDRITSHDTHPTSIKNLADSDAQAAKSPSTWSTSAACSCVWDENAFRRERSHLAALAAAAEEHLRTRVAAERELEKLAYEKELAADHAKHEEEMRRLEQYRQAAERDWMAAEKDHHEQLQKMRAAKEAADLASQKAEEELKRTRRRAEEVQASTQAAVEQAPAKAPAVTKAADQGPLMPQAPKAAPSKHLSNSTADVQNAPVNGLVTPANTREAVHEQYLALHKRLKDMRKFVGRNKQGECDT